MNKTLPCSICKKKLKSAAILKEHMLTHQSSAKKFIWTLCYKRYKEKRSLRRHHTRKFHRVIKIEPEKIGSNIPITPSESIKVKKVVKRNSSEADNNEKRAEEGNLRFKCNSCDKKIKDKQQLRMHNLFTCVERPFTCPQCDMKFLQINHCERHLTAHEGFTKKCQFKNCGMTFWSNELLNEHQRIKGHEGQKYFTNIKEESESSESESTEYFSDDDETSQMESESEIDTDSEIQSFDCQKCKKTYQFKSSLKRHNNIHHAVNFKTLNDLKTITQLFSKNRKFSCNLCDLKFTKISSLKDHLKSHKRCKFKCKICGFKYHRKIILEEHQKRAHANHKPQKNGGIKKLNGQSLTRHMKNNAASSQNTSKLSPRKRKLSCYQCDLSDKEEIENHKFKCDHKGCGMTFKTDLILQAHQKRVHEEIIKEEFDCTQCDKKFKRIHNLEGHLMRHKNFKFICKVENCSMKFGMQIYLNEHQERAHKKEIEVEKVSENWSEDLKNAIEQISAPSVVHEKQPEVILEIQSEVTIDEPLNKKDESTQTSPLTISTAIINPVEEKEAPIEKCHKSPSNLEYGCVVCRVYFPDNALLWEHLIKERHL